MIDALAVFALLVISSACFAGFATLALIIKDTISGWR